MFVDIVLLHSGARESHRSGRHADDGANHLARTSPVTGIFGDFAAAQDFHEAVSIAHAEHTAVLRANRETLSDIGSKARAAAVDFTAMDDRNTLRIRGIRCNSAA